MFLANAIAALENAARFDGDVDIDINVTDEDVEQAQDVVDEQVEQNEEIHDTGEELEDAATAYLELVSNYHKIETMRVHVEHYGVDRTFMRLYNSTGDLSTLLNTPFPAAEAFNEVGSSYNKYSSICVEGLGDVARSIWDKIKGVGNKISSVAGSLIDKIKKYLPTIENRLRNISEYYNKAIDAADKIPAGKYFGYGASGAKERVNVMVKIEQRIKKAMTDLVGMVRKALAKGNYDPAMLDNQKNNLAEIQSILHVKPKKADDKVDLSTVSWRDVGALIESARKMFDLTKDNLTALEEMKTLSKEFNKELESQATKETKKAYLEASTLCTTYLTTLKTCHGQYSKYINLFLKSAKTRIKKGSEKNSSSGASDSDI